MKHVTEFEGREWMHYNCLIVDDEIELAQATQEYFNLFDVSCETVASIAACEEFLAQHQVDLLLLDINLQGESGFNLCKKLRETSDIPILFISARQSDDDILIALNIGGDDYIKKPYTLSVLLAKVKVMLKRMTPRNKENDVQSQKEEKEISRVRFLEGTMKVYVDDREAELRAKEYKLFTYLYEHRNHIVTKDELFAAVWGDAFYSDGTLNVHIRKLREKLEVEPNEPTLIKTIWGTGYMLEDM